MSLVRFLVGRHHPSSVRGFATATFSKFGLASQVVTLGADTPVKSLGDKEVAIKLLAAPITPHDLQVIQGKSGQTSLPTVPGGEGVGIVTGVGAKVTGLKVDDWVIPAAPSFGECTSDITFRGIPYHHRASSHTVMEYT